MVTCILLGEERRRAKPIEETILQVKYCLFGSDYKIHSSHMLTQCLIRVKPDLHGNITQTMIYA